MTNDNIIYGINPITQMLGTMPNKILEITISQDKNDPRMQKIIALAKEHSIAVHRIDPKKLAKMFATENHQGIIAKIKATSLLSENDLASLLKSTDNPLFLILDGVQDPHNFGACLRTADAAGVTAVIIPKDNAVGITPVVRKVASGAADTVPIVQVSNLARVMRDLQELGCWIVGTDGEGTQNIYDVDLKGSIAIVMGAEGEGMRQLTKKHCDFLAKIPMQGTVESLNVSVATGICLFEAQRQRLNR